MELFRRLSAFTSSASASSATNASPADSNSSNPNPTSPAAAPVPAVREQRIGRKEQRLSKVSSFAPTSKKYDDDDELPQTASASAPDDAKSEKTSSGSAIVTLTPELTSYKAGDSLDVLVTLSASSGEVQGAANAAQRPGVDLIAVIDVSGSMQTARKINNAILTAKFIVESMGSGDRVAIISFTSSAQRELKLTRMTDTNKVTALAVAEGLRADGGTNILKAVDMALGHLSGRKHKNPVAGILLLTDGQDSTTIDGVKRAIEEHEMVGCVPIHTMAFGVDHKAELLRQIAEETLGTYSFIEDAESVSDAVAPALAGMLSIVSKATSITVAGEDATLKSVETGAYKSKLENGKAVIQAGDCYDGENRKFLLTVQLTSIPAQIIAEYSYTDPMLDQVKTGNAFLQLESSGAADEAKNNAEVTEFKLNLMFKSALKSALEFAGQGRYTDAKVVLEQVLKNVQEYPHPIPEDAKAGLVAEISGNLEKMAQLEKRGNTDATMSKAYMADMNAAKGEMEVQRAGLNAMKKSNYSKAKYSTKRQEAVSEKAADYWSSSRS
eukprot:TRINITY_DN1351_c0_g2_i1.p1 TRINITY_DN1351_c0_g2~~TRINITY_DN1351_c0_g2_i1.p1  ORF type:complete len:554 (-),score=184.65 TRINITY_DN1351_c0_g2_i1:85-1746(-)